MKTLFYLLLVMLLLSSLSTGQDNPMIWDLQWINLEDYKNGLTTPGLCKDWEEMRNAYKPILVNCELSDDQSLRVHNIYQKPYYIYQYNSDFSLRQATPLVNGDLNVQGASISKDGSCIVFTVYQGKPYEDQQAFIYIREKQSDGTYSEPR